MKGDEHLVRKLWGFLRQPECGEGAGRKTGAILSLSVPLPAVRGGGVPAVCYRRRQAGESGGSGADGRGIRAGHPDPGQASGGWGDAVLPAAKASKASGAVLSHLPGGALFLHLPTERGIFGPSGGPDRSNDPPKVRLAYSAVFR